MQIQPYNGRIINRKILMNQYTRCGLHMSDVSNHLKQTSKKRCGLLSLGVNNHHKVEISPGQTDKMLINEAVLKS